MTTSPSPAPGPPRPGRSPRRWRAAALAGLASVALAACAAVPDSGSAQRGKVALTAGGQGQDYLQLIPAPPKQGWGPVQIVSGFLAACASLADNFAVAKQYLDPAVRDSWNPGWAVTVVGSALRLGPVDNLTHQAGPYNQMAVVKATGEKLAALTNTGQYVGTQGSSTYTFELFKIHGQWRIEKPPSQLLLTQPDFKRVYAPRNLYFLAGPSPVLAPDPVFVPLQASYAALAKNLVTGLLSRPQGWLASAVTTAFPNGTTLRQVALNDGTATIDLGGAAVRASKAALGQMTYQLVWTLAGPSYGQSAIQSVNLEIDGRLRQSASLPGSPGARPGLSVPTAAAGAPLYALDAGGRIQDLTSQQISAPILPGKAGARLATIAVSPGGQYAGGLTRSGMGVYYGALRRDARLSEWAPGGTRFTSVSWDASGNLWAAATSGVWMLRPGSDPVPLGLGLPAGTVVSQFRVAPDGVRVAMIVYGPAWNGPHLLLAAIEHVPGGGAALGSTVPAGDDLSSPMQVTWYDADNLIVLSRSPSGPQLREVPVNGGSSIALITAPGTQSISAAGPANPLVAGLAGGQLALTSSLNGTWVTQPGAGMSPGYPG